MSDPSPQAHGMPRFLAEFLLLTVACAAGGGSAAAAETGDTNPPCLLRAVARPDPTNGGYDQVFVSFSKLMNPDDLVNLDCYLLAPAGDPANLLPIVTATTLSGSNVMLTAIRRAPETDYLLTVANLGDASSPRMVVRPPCDQVDVESEVKLLQLEAWPLATASWWRYRAAAGDPGAAWRERGYDDTAWPAGASPLDAYNDSAPGRTVLPNGMAVGAQLPRIVLPDYITRYFRTWVNIPASVQDVKLAARFLVDDGCVVYVNGKEAYRLGMPASAVTYLTAANRTVNNPAPNIEGPFNLPSTNVVPGDNLIAVELHQANTNSTDATLGLELLAYVRHFAIGPVVISVQPKDGTIAEGQSYTFTVSAGGEIPLSYQWYRGGEPIDHATNTSYSIISANITHQGDYSVVVTNPRGPVSSRTAHLTVIPDTTPPRVVAAVGGRPTNLTVVVSFSKPLESTAAQQPTNYTLVGPGELLVTNAALSGTNVTLRLSGPRQPDVLYTLFIRDLKDRAFVPNALDPNPSRVLVSTMVELVSLYGQSWKFLEQNSSGEPAPCLDGMPWTAPGFDDHAWSNGLALFYGHRSNDISPITLPMAIDRNNPATTTAQSLLNVFTNTTPSNGLQELTYYFRTTFDYPGNTNGASLLIHTFLDDGAVFYLNGNRIYDVRLTNDAPTCDSLANQSVTLPFWEPGLNSPGRAISMMGLQPGRNTLAVELHQANDTSPAVALGVLLEGVVAALAQPSISASFDRPAQSLTLTWDAGPEWKLYASSGLGGPWTNRVADLSPYTNSTATGTSFFRLQKAP